MDGGRQPGEDWPRLEDGPGPLWGKDEMNLAEFPITLLADRPTGGETVIVRQVDAVDDRTGVAIRRRVTVTVSGHHGLPNSKDALVLLGLVYLTKRANDFASRRVWFTRAELLKVLEWPETGPYYKRVADSFRRWTEVFCLYEDSWWDKSRPGYSTKGFGILDDFELVDGGKGGDGLGPSKSNFAWNEAVFESLRSGFVRTLDLRLLFRLKHPTSQQMYRYLGKHFYRTSELRLPLRTFACEHVGLGRNYPDAGKLKEKLQPALDELEAAGFLAPMSRAERYQKVGRGEWTITLRRASKPPVPVEPSSSSAAVAATTPPSPALSVDPGRAGAIAALITRGVTPSTAIELADSAGPEAVAARVEAFDWLAGRNDRRISKNPAGYLADSIRKRYEPPKGFESSAERDRRLAFEAERGRALEEAKARAEAERKAREQAEQARIDAFWEGLGPDRRAAVLEDAIRLGDPSLAAQYRRALVRRPDAAEFYRKLLLGAYLARVVGGPDAP